MRWMALMISSLKYLQVRRTQQFKEHTASRNRKALNLVSLQVTLGIILVIMTHAESQIYTYSNDLMPLALTIEISFLVHSTLRDCCARFLCSWVMYDCDDIALSSTDPHPNEVKKRVVEFLRSEVR